MPKATKETRSMRGGLVVTQQQLWWPGGQNTYSPPQTTKSSESLLLLTIFQHGSDTTAPSLINLLYLLVRQPCDMDIIKQELSTVDTSDVKAVAALPHLNGAINEAMRLLPAVLTFVTRVTPPEGLVVGDTFIPGSVKIAAPRYSIGRRKSCLFAVPTHAPLASAYTCGLLQWSLLGTNLTTFAQLGGIASRR